MLSSPHFSCLCFKFGQVILPHTMSSPQFLFPSPQVSSESPLVSKGPFCPKRACESMWIRAIPHRSGSIDSARAVDGSTYYEYVAGIVHISTQLGNSTRLTFHEGKRRRPRRRTLPRRAIDAATRSHRLKYRLGHDATPPCGPCCARAHELTKLPPPLAGRAMRKQVRVHAMTVPGSNARAA